VSNPDKAALHLRLVRFFPTTIESVFRAAVRESVLVRGAGSDLRAFLRARASFHFERVIHGSPIAVADRERAERTLHTAVDRFARSALCRRLSRMPVERLHLIQDDTFDLLAMNAAGKTYAIRFAGPIEKAQSKQVLRLVESIGPDIAGILIYDIKSGTTKRTDFDYPSHRSFAARDLLKSCSRYDRESGPFFRVAPRSPSKHS
jgi:hypothetical protein